MKQLGFWIVNTALFVLFFANNAFAQTDTSPKVPNISTLPGPKDERVSQVGSFVQGSFLPRIAQVVLSIAIFASVAFLIVGVIQFLTSFGDAQKNTNAKKTVAWAIIGLVITLLSFAIVQIIFFTGFRINLAQ